LCNCLALVRHNDRRDIVHPSRGCDRELLHEFTRSVVLSVHAHFILIAWNKIQCRSSLYVNLAGPDPHVQNYARVAGTVWRPYFKPSKLLDAQRHLKRKASPRRGHEQPGGMTPVRKGCRHTALIIAPRISSQLNAGVQTFTQNTNTVNGCRPLRVCSGPCTHHTTNEADVECI
jgi:hypothetical protein